MRTRLVAAATLSLVLLAFIPQRSAAVPADFACSAVTEIPEAECVVLVTLYNDTDGANWLNNGGWLVSDTPCSWHGVSCHSGHVNSVELTTNQLSGSIPPELGSLSYLRFLGLGWNDLSGGIPPELGNLTNLVWLHLDDNQLDGSIPPELGNLANLDWLHLDNNLLSGDIPPELGALGGLLTLSLNANQLTGTIPSELGLLTSLEDLHLQQNPVSGALPRNLMNLTTLELFWFHDTDLCEPPDSAYRAWLDGIADLSSTGVVCDWEALYTPLVLR